MDIGSLQSGIISAPNVVVLSTEQTFSDQMYRPLASLPARLSVTNPESGSAVEEIEVDYGGEALNEAESSLFPGLVTMALNI